MTKIKRKEWTENKSERKEEGREKESFVFREIVLLQQETWIVTLEKELHLDRQYRNRAQKQCLISDFSIKTEGMDSGFGDEDSYNIYNKPLFQGSSATQIYRPKKGDDETYGSESDLNKLKDTSKFKPDKGFTGAEKPKEDRGERSGPVEFEKVEEDPFGLDEFLSKAKTSAKPLDKIGTRGHMNVASSNASELAEGQGSKRERISFQSSSDRDSKKRRQ